MTNKAMLRFLSGTVLSVAALGACGDASGPKSPPAARYRPLVFQSHRTFDNEIWGMWEDGSQLFNLTQAPGAEDQSPTISPDRSRIAFVSDRSGDDEVWVMARDGSGPTRITNQAGVAELPAWSPDGQYLAYERHDPNVGGPLTGIHVIGVTGTGDTLVSATGSQPTWVPDGHLGYIQGGQIWTANADGSNPIQLTFDSLVKIEPVWSPDGARIAFSANGKVGVMQANGTGPVLITTGTRERSQPAWSPDGQQLAVICDVATIQGDVNFDICLVPAAGGSLTDITNLGAPDTHPSWSTP